MSIAYTTATGRRKSSVAQIRIRPGTGLFLVNKREIGEYFPSPEWLRTAESPLAVVDKRKAFDVHVNVRGGGLTGQAGAIAMGVARALVTIDTEAHKAAMRQGGLLTRDSRMKERKKYGQRGARRAFQFSKR
ncbi:MAG: 30S ribosomal protein S9 [Planctomycetes bacterium]|nr:30S ribosomal protein S9 [Planctomycetota bacterium]